MARLPQQQSDFDINMAHAAQFAAQGLVAQAIGFYRTAATAAESRGEFRNALRAYAEIVRIEGPNSDTQLKLGEMQYRSGRPREAAATLDRAANLTLQAGRVEMGLYAYRLAAIADPTTARWKQLIDWCRNLGKHDEAQRHLEEGAGELFRAEAFETFVYVANLLLELKPTDVPTLRMLMRAHLHRKDVHRAATTIQRILNERPGDADALERMAETFAELGRTDKAAEVTARLATMLAMQGGPSREEAKRIVDRGLGWNRNNGQLLALKRQFNPPPPRPAPRPAPREEIPTLDLSEFVEVVPSETEYENDFEGPDYTMVREHDIIEVAELTMVTKQFDLRALAKLYPERK